MERYIFLVFSNPTAGREDEYNIWYDDTHLDEVVDMPAFVAATRFKLVDADGPWRYLAIYDIETDDLPGAFEEIQRRVDAGKIVVSPAMDSSAMLTGTYKKISSRQNRG